MGKAKRLVWALVLGAIPLTTAVSCDPYGGFAFYRNDDDDYYYYPGYGYGDVYIAEPYYYYDGCYYGGCYDDYYYW